MPTYEYECQNCQYRYELYQSIKDQPKKTCPKCKGRVKRLFSAGGGLLFKGSGFYVTDYRKPGYKEAAKQDSATPVATGPAKESTTKESAPKESTTKESTPKSASTKS